MKKTQFKDSVRNIRKNFVSWLAVAVVTMICCGVFFGSLFYVDSMGKVVTDFAKDTNFEDINILAPSGLKKDEVERLKDTDGVSDAEGTYQLSNALLKYNNHKIKIEIDGLTERVSVPQVLEGELPKASDECALVDDTMKEYGIQVGDTVSIDPGKDTPDGLLENEIYTVTARVLHPDCFYTGSTGIVFLPAEAFNAAVTDGNYTYIRIDADLSGTMRLLDAGYKAALLPVKEQLEEDLKSIGREHDNRLRNDAQEELDRTRADVYAELDSAKEQLDKARDELDANESQLEQMEAMGLDTSDARANLAEARDELNKNQKDYEVQKEDAEKEIADAQKKIDDIKQSHYMLISRTQLEGYIMLRENITILQALAVVFVIIFTGIGAIVVFSTITILIDGQREQIGTMKAIGFRNKEIVGRYLLFGVLAVAFGMILSVGLEMFLQVIMHHEIGPMFCVGPEKLAFNGIIFAILFVLEILVASAVTVFVTVKKAVKTSAVDLMNKTTDQAIRGEAAASGKGSLYSRLILRNMRTDLARVICSMVIIAGSALMIGVGFTLNGALNNMMKYSASMVNHYDIEAACSTDSKDEDYLALKDFLTQEGISFAEVEKKMTMYNAGNFEESVTIVTGSEDVFQDYIQLSTMKGNMLSLPQENEVLVCSRISENIPLKTGDEIKIFDGDFVPHPVTVSGICRNYYGSLMVLSEAGYHALFGEEPVYHTLLIRVGEKQNREAITDRIREDHPEFDLLYTDEMPENYQGLTRMFTMLVVVMTGLSIVMSIFVLLNLVNIFVKRRQNELIVMRVIGFSYKQDIGYLLKETVVTTIVGIAGGVLMGCLMTEFLVRTVEGTDTMFVRSVSPTAWLFAILLEGTFALLINRFAFRRVKSLKLTDITQ